VFWSLFSFDLNEIRTLPFPTAQFTEKKCFAMFDRAERTIVDKLIRVQITFTLTCFEDILSLTDSMRTPMFCPDIISLVLLHFFPVIFLINQPSIN
jgi:hypothetical protein